MASYIFIQFNPKHADGFNFAATTKIVGVNIQKMDLYSCSLDVRRAAWSHFMF